MRGCAASLSPTWCAVIRATCTGATAIPTPGEIANCGSHLRAELDLVQARIVVCLGRIAWHTLAGREYPFAPRHPIIVETKGMRLLPMYHPAYVIRGAYAERHYRRDYVRLARLLRAQPGT